MGIYYTEKKQIRESGEEDLIDLQPTTALVGERADWGSVCEDFPVRRGTQFPSSASPPLPLSFSLMSSLTFAVENISL